MVLFAQLDVLKRSTEWNWKCETKTIISNLLFSFQFMKTSICQLINITILRVAKICINQFDLLTFWVLNRTQKNLKNCHHHCRCDFKIEKKMILQALLTYLNVTQKDQLIHVENLIKTQTILYECFYSIDFSFNLNWKLTWIIIFELVQIFLFVIVVNSDWLK